MRRVTVSIPTYDNPDTLHRAVTSVLAQTMSDVSVVVSDDAGHVDAANLLADVRDPRLTVVTHDRNRGRYWCDADTFARSDSEWFTVLDADDWVEPDWLESMLAVSDGAEVVVGPHTDHNLAGDATVVALRPYTGRFVWHTHMGACLYSSAFLRRSGLLSGALRVGWDNIVTGFPLMASRWVQHDRAAYHRVKRAGSLTEDRRSGFRSHMRAATVGVLRGVWDDLLENPYESACIIGSVQHERSAGMLIRELPVTDWSMQAAALAELDAWLWRESPRTVVELGSGLSTVVMANYARYSGAHVVSVDHDRRFMQQTANLLAQHSLSGVVDLRHAAIDEQPMYQTGWPDGIEFALIDGPPDRLGGRHATLDALMPYMAPSWSAWLDDGDRPGEKQAVASWRKSHGIKAQTTSLPHSPTILRPTSVRAKRDNAKDVTLAVLTGHRPQYLARTLAALPSWLLSTARVVVLHDGGDQATVDVLAKYETKIDRLIRRKHPRQKMHTIGDNWSLLAEHADTEFFLMLEDDWEFVGFDPEWLSNARNALTDGVVQVRLRSVAEGTLTKHMVTGRPFDWSPHPYGWIADTHVSWAANLMRSDMLPVMFPADGERDCQRRAFDAGLRCVVQANPGCFMHIGDESVRLELHPPA